MKINRARLSEITGTSTEHLGARYGDDLVSVESVARIVIDQKDHDVQIADVLIGVRDG